MPRGIRVPINTLPNQGPTQWVLLFPIQNSWYLESSELSRVLGYSRPRALRETRVLNKLPKDSYRLIDPGSVTNDYLNSYESRIGSVMGRHPLDDQARLTDDPVVFFTMTGVQALLNRSKKPMVGPLRHALTSVLREMEAARLPGVSFNLGESSSDPSPKLDPPLQERTPPGPSSYEVLQTLLSQLQTLSDDLLKHLAVDAAEEALGRDLSRYRPRSGTVSSKVPDLVTPPDRVIPDGEWLSMSRIGKRAGGYTAHQAGKAVTLVAQRLGIDPYAIRNYPKDVNRFIEAKDSNGTLRKMVQFRADFARKVVEELQTNSSFEPRFVPTPEDSVRPFVEGQFQDLLPDSPNE